jgi:hypothetical protein
MPMMFPDPLATLAVRHAEELLAYYVGAGVCTDDRWTRVLDGLQQDGQGVVPRARPASGTSPVITFRVDGEPFGPLLEASSRLVHEGGAEAAQHTAEAARTLRVLSTVPHLRHRQDLVLAPEAGVQQRFWHRVENEAGGFLAITVQDLTAALGGALPDRGLLPRPAPSDPQAWVVVWKSLTASVVVLGGVGLLAQMPDRDGVDWLMRNLDTAAKALVPGPPEREWKA